MKRIIKILILIILILLVMAGAIYVLLRSGILEAPRFLPSLPLVGQYFAPKDEVKIDPALLKANQENERLQKSVDQKEKEMEQLQDELKSTQGQLQKSKLTQNQAKEEMDKVSQRLLDLQNASSSSSTTDKVAAYKDIAQYFGEMKVKDAADILGRLKDEDVIGILGEMEPDTAAEVLQNMDRNKAASVTRKMLVTSSNP